MPPHPALPASYLPFTALLRGDAADLLRLDAPLWLTRAPGRLDVLGGPGEEPGAASVAAPLARCAYCAIQSREDQAIRVRWLRPASQGGPLNWEGDVGSLYTKKGPPRSLAVLRQVFTAERAWMMAVVAAMLGLRRTRQLNTPKRGFDLVLWSRLPEEAGFGQAAALGTAVAMGFKAFSGLAKRRVDGIQVARAVVQGAREILGVEIPLADALTSALGRRNCVLYMEHGAEPAMQWVPLPPQCLLAAVELGAGGAVPEAELRAAQVGASMALAHLNAALKRDHKAPVPGLGKVNPAEFEEAWKGLIPVEEPGGEWLKVFRRAHEELAAAVDKDRVYRLRALAEHQVQESERVRRFVSNVAEYARTMREGFLGEAGRCLSRSASSLELSCGFQLGGVAPFLAAVRDAGREVGIFGARASDCGRFGVVAVLLHQSARQPLRELAEQHACPPGRVPTIVSDTEDGCVLSGWWEGILEPREGQPLTLPISRPRPVGIPGGDESRLPPIPDLGDFGAGDLDG